MRTPLSHIINQLTENKLTHLELKKILANPRHDPHVGEVSCYRDEDLIQLANAIYENTSLEKFTIHGMDSTCSPSWTAVGAQALGNALKNHPNLNHIYLDLQYMLKDNALIDFMLSVTGSAPLKALYLMFYCDSEAFINQLSNLLVQNTSLEHITIEGRIKNSSMCSEQTVKNFARGLSNKPLNSLQIDSLSLGNDGINYLIQQVSLTKLTHLTFRGCQLTPDAFSSWHELFAGNKILSLDLSGNSLFALEEDYQSVAFLKNFPTLKKLSLRGTGITTNTLKQLVTQLKSNLPIEKLDISSSKLDGASMLYINELIEAKTNLKSLVMNFCRINDEQIASLYPTLSNPQRCHLQHISFADNQKLSATTYNSLLSILKNNVYLGDINPPLNYPRLKEATQLHKIRAQKRQQSQFINEAMELANAFYPHAESENNHIATLPLELLMRILLELGKDTPGLNEAQLIACSSLILNNYKIRRELINDKDYLPEVEVNSTEDTQPNQGIRRWWSQSTINAHTGAPQRLFTSKSVIEFPEVEEKAEAADAASKGMSCIIM